MHWYASKKMFLQEEKAVAYSGFACLDISDAYFTIPTVLFSAHVLRAIFNKGRI